MKIYYWLLYSFIRIISIKTLWIVAVLFALNNTLLAQSFVNGDLEGIEGQNQIAPGWQNVPLTDPNYQGGGTIGSDTPDLIGLIGFGTIPIAGIPYSGNTFAAGIGSIANHEGIMQSVSGFTIGNTYFLRFQQTVILRTIGAIDSTGSWAVYLDTNLIGITIPSTSLGPADSINLIWESRSFSFVASSTSHLIKFMPYDYDNGYNGATGFPIGNGENIYMGIDSISLNLSTSIGEINKPPTISIYPNPTLDWITISIKAVSKASKIIIYNIQGQVVLTDHFNNTNELNINLDTPAGIYFLQLEVDGEFITKKILKQ